MPLLLFALLPLAATIVLLVMYLRERTERHQRNLIGKWPILPVSLERIDPVFRQGPFGAGLETEVAFVGKGPLTVEGGTVTGTKKPAMRVRMAG